MCVYRLLPRRCRGNADLFPIRANAKDSIGCGSPGLPAHRRAVRGAAIFCVVSSAHALVWTEYSFLCIHNRRKMNTATSKNAGLCQQWRRYSRGLGTTLCGLALVLGIMLNALGGHGLCHGFRMNQSAWTSS